MIAIKPNSLPKTERICSKLLIDRLFQGGESKSFSSYPLRAVFLFTERKEGEPAAKFMVSVSKRHFKQAVKRNKVKRQIREAYRTNKQIVVNKLNELGDKQLHIAFLWLANDIYPTAEVTQRIYNLLARIKEKL